MAVRVRVGVREAELVLPPATLPKSNPTLTVYRLCKSVVRVPNQQIDGIHAVEECVSIE